MVRVRFKDRVRVCDMYRLGLGFKVFFKVLGFRIVGLNSMV